MNKYNFQYCPKIVVLSKDKDKVLLGRRKGEADYDGIYSFIGGKMENTDKSIIEGIKREKDEEAGSEFKILLCPVFSLNLTYNKKDGKSMILPHYLAIHQGGEIKLNKEYSDYQWVKLNKLEEFEPKIAGIPETVNKLLKLEKIADKKDFILI